MSDLSLRQDILEALAFEPSIDAADIGVAVESGTVTLTGHVSTYGQKMTAERIVMRVRGVRAVAEEIEVRPMGKHLNADDEIAKRVVLLLDWNSSVPHGAVQVKVAQGHVTLTGKVAWNYQKLAASDILHILEGVTGITNAIEIEADPDACDIGQKIAAALKRDAALAADVISVEVENRKVTLSGAVLTWAEREAAERAAWSTPGVEQVVDRITVAG